MRKETITETLVLFESFVTIVYGHIETTEESSLRMTMEAYAQGRHERELAKKRSRAVLEDEQYMADWNEQLVQHGVYRTATSVYRQALAALLCTVAETGAGFPSSLVDVGCGLGILPHFLKEEGLIQTVLGVEPCTGYEASGEVHIPILHSMPTSIMLPSGSAGAVICIDVLSICFGWERVLREISRIAADGAPIVILYFYGDGRVDVDPADVARVLIEEGVDVILAIEMDAKVGYSHNIITGIKRLPRGFPSVQYTTDEEVKRKIKRS